MSVRYSDVSLKSMSYIYYTMHRYNAKLNDVLSCNVNLRDRTILAAYSDNEYGTPDVLNRLVPETIARIRNSRASEDLSKFLIDTIEEIVSRHKDYTDLSNLRLIVDYYDNDISDHPGSMYAIHRFNYKAYATDENIIRVFERLFRRQNEMLAKCADYVLHDLEDYIVSRIDELSYVDFLQGLLNINYDFAAVINTLSLFNDVVLIIELLFGFATDEVPIRTVDGIKMYSKPRYECPENLEFETVERFRKQQEPNIFKHRDVKSYISKFDKIYHCICQNTSSDNYDRNGVATAYVDAVVLETSNDIFELIRNDPVLGTKRSRDSETSRQMIYSAEDYYKYYEPRPRNYDW